MMLCVYFYKERNLAEMCAKDPALPGPELFLHCKNTGRKVPVGDTGTPTLSPSSASQTFLPSAILCSQSMRSRQTRAGFSLVPKGVLMLWMRLLR